MKKERFLKGAALFAVARKKANALGLDPKGMKIEELILLVQEKEGHVACFRTRQTCPEKTCCWQVSCGASITAA